MSAGKISRLKSSKISLLKTREPSSLNRRSLASRWMSVPSRALRGSEIGEQEEDISLDRQQIREEETNPR